ncbi:MAG: phosphoribosylformylglycinamidine synthase subunit PurQ [Alphaproteobacteria bacterium]
MKTAVIVFPGSNCDRDLAESLEAVTGQQCIRVWHREPELPDVDFVGLPGGFSYGDYLRCGALAATSPIIRDLKTKVAKGLPVIGICNGFQILCETGILPGMLMGNKHGRFVHRDETLKVESVKGPFFERHMLGAKLDFSVAHHDGSYQADEEILDKLEDQGRIAFSYTNNPNGSARNIAGILSANHKVLGLMPHPERHMGGDGKRFFEAAIGALS